MDMVSVLSGPKKYHFWQCSDPKISDLPPRMCMCWVAPQDLANTASKFLLMKNVHLSVLVLSSETKLCFLDFAALKSTFCSVNWSGGQGKVLGVDVKFLGDSKEKHGREKGLCSFH